MSNSSQLNLIYTQGKLKDGEDLKDKMYYLVIEKSDGVQLAGAGELALGVLHNKPTSGSSADSALICLGPTSKVVIGGDVTKGDKLACNASGQAVTRTTENWIIGIAKESGVAGDIIEIDILRSYIA